MKKKFLTLFFCAVCTVALTVFARAAEDTVKVGLYYGSSALESANLENAEGSGYTLGWFDETTRDFIGIGYLENEAITVTVNCGYHVQIEEEFASFEEAKYVADQFRTGFVCYINNVYRVRVNTFSTRDEAEIAAATYATYVWYDVYGNEYPFSGTATSPSATGVTVIVTDTNTILFEFDCSGAKSLGILPNDGQEGTLTWFRGYKWYGGFEYRRSTGGNINVINVVDVEDYVKGVLPYEMDSSFPLEALKAQAVCARTYALLQHRHSSYSFDICNTTHCQVYYGANKASAVTDQAAEETCGIVVTYDGKMAATYYHSSNGGATESSENVWTSAQPHLIGKEDPYEALVSIRSYTYTVTYTFEQLAQLLQSEGYEIGAVNAAYVSETTPTGNVAEVTVEDTAGKKVCISGDKIRNVFSTGMFGKTQSVKSLRFTITGGESTCKYFVNDATTGVNTVSGLYTISGNGTVDSYSGGETYVITSSGTSLLEEKEEVEAGSGITITGAGYGHNVGMSQHGARAMAGLGYTYEDILYFYYTGISLERVGFIF